jgi:hypothetical protein
MSDADIFGGPQGPQAPISGPDGWSTAAKPMINSTGVGSIMSAFGQGFGEAWGPERLGLSRESTQWLSEKGIFAPKGQTHYENPFQAFNEGVMVNVATALDVGVRTASGLFRGGQAATMEALGGSQLGRDIAAIPEAFMGSPGGLGKVEFRSGLGKDVRAGIPTEPVAEGEPGLRRVIIDHPAEVEAAPAAEAGVGMLDPGEKIDRAAIKIGDKIYTGYNHTDALDRASKDMKITPEEFTLQLEGHDNVGLDGFVTTDGRYLTRLEAYAIQDAIEAKAAETITQAKDLGVIGPERPPITDGTPKEVAERVTTMAAEGPKGEKVTQELPDQPNPWRERFEQFVGKVNTADDAKQLIRDAADQNGEFQAAREGKIPLKQSDAGPLGKMSDADFGAISSVAVDTRYGDTHARLALTPEEIKTAQAHGIKIEDNGVLPNEEMQRILDERDRRNAAYKPSSNTAGPVPPHQLEALTQAAGVDASTVSADGIGRLLQNDNQVRNAMQGMLTATENVRNAARDVKADPSEANLMKLQEAMLRRDTWVEQVVGHRAEWGRTGNVFQEFLQKSKEEGGFTQFLKDQDRSPEGLRKIADALGDMDGTQAARFLSESNKPTFWDKFRFYWINALISGPVTHAKYIVANGAFSAYESAVVTPVAGVVGAVRRGMLGDVEGVYVGEAAARIWGLIAGVPDAMKAAVSAAKTGLQTPLPGELAQSIIPKQNKNVTFQQRPIPGTWGAIIGAPSRGASAIHSFFNFLGYRASIEAQAYRAAAADGLKLSDDAFWQRRAAAADAPSLDMMNSAIEEGYRLTYISELGKTGKALSSFVHSTKVGTLIMPFTHIPMNILKRAVEGTPAAFLDTETRAALKGEAGAAKQDMAIARMVVGSAVGVWAVNQVLNERMTGFGPTEPKERAQWIATGHQPYSIRIGDYWYSFNRFGSLGTMLGLYSNIAEVIPHLKPDAEELTKAIGMTVHSTGRLMEDEVGMQGLAGLMEAINEPDRKGAKFVSNFAGSLLPYSSMQRQVASSMDPYMRETKSVVDGLRYYIPGQRQGLDLKRDWTGLPVANAGYGGDVPNAPGLSSIIQHRNAVADPIALEMQALDLRPAAPQNRISGVKLPPKIYDAYQSTAGAFTREALTHYVEQPNWHELPAFVREQMFKATIESTRKAAAAATQMQYPQIIQQGVADRTAKIRGEKPTKMPDIPTSGPALDHAAHSGWRKDPSLIMNGPAAGLGIRG